MARTLGDVNEVEGIAVEPIRVVVRAADHLARAGLSRYLADRPDVVLAEPRGHADADVVVMGIRRLVGDVATGLRRAAVEVGAPIVLVADVVEPEDPITAVGCRVAALLPRALADGERVVGAVLAAAAARDATGEELLSALDEQVRRDLGEVDAHGFSLREVDVLRLMAEGFDTAEIATKLCYSERTVKHVFSRIATRHNLRNRPHAVAYALREGMI